MACVVKNLFDEYRFFPDYPDKELRTTAEVYGGLIREGIITCGYFVLLCHLELMLTAMKSITLMIIFDIMSLATHVILQLNNNAK